jgi:hypothetical protein
MNDVSFLTPMVSQILFRIFYQPDSKSTKLNCLPKCGTSFSLMFYFFNYSPVDILKWYIAHFYSKAVTLAANAHGLLPRLRFATADRPAVEFKNFSGEPHYKYILLNGEANRMQAFGKPHVVLRLSVYFRNIKFSKLILPQLISFSSINGSSGVLLLLLYTEIL